MDANLFIAEMSERLYARLNGRLMPQQQLHIMEYPRPSPSSSNLANLKTSYTVKAGAGQEAADLRAISISGHGLCEQEILIDIGARRLPREPFCDIPHTHTQRGVVVGRHDDDAVLTSRIAARRLEVSLVRRTNRVRNWCGFVHVVSWKSC